MQPAKALFTIRPAAKRAVRGGSVFLEGKVL